MRRVVITGMGAVTPVGNDIETMWNSLKNGVCGIDFVEEFKDMPVTFAGKVKNFDPEKFGMDKPFVRKQDHFTQYAIAAAWQAMQQSGLCSEGEGANIVFGVRNDRTTDTVMKRTTADWYYRTLNALGVHTIPQHADFRLMDREALEALSQYREVNLFLRGIATDIGLKTDCVYYSRKARTAGESKYSLKKMLLLAEDGVTSFSTAPLKISFGFGAAADGAALVLLFRAMRDRKSQAGIMALICFMQSIQFYLSGILGTYIGKTYTEVKDRPRYYIQERTGEK